MPALILVRGGGDLASGVALRLHRAGLNVIITELPQPLAVRRTVAFAEAVYEGQQTVEGITARSVPDPTDTLRIISILSAQHIPVIVDAACASAQGLHPLVIVDARMTKQPPQPFPHSALLYIGLGPGFVAGDNCHAVIETNRGHFLGRVYWQGSAQPDTAQPEGDPRRTMRAPADGILTGHAEIGQHVEAGQVIATVEGHEVTAPLAGVLRGLLRSGLKVSPGMKIGDVDPRDDPLLCRFISDKSLAVGGGVLEAILAKREVRARLWD